MWLKSEIYLEVYIWHLNYFLHEADQKYNKFNVWGNAYPLSSQE